MHQLLLAGYVDFFEAMLQLPGNATRNLSLSLSLLFSVNRFLFLSTQENSHVVKALKIFFISSIITFFSECTSSTKAFSLHQVLANFLLSKIIFSSTHFYSPFKISYFHFNKIIHLLKLNYFKFFSIFILLFSKHFRCS